mgnify:CR=1 FL=1
MGKRGPPPGTPRVGGRQKGTPNRSNAEIKALAQKYTSKVIEELAKLAGVNGKEGVAESEQARIAAMKELMDRGHGKPAQALTGEDGEGPARIEISWVSDAKE